ncbi:centrosomal protein 20 isoform X2 [Tympanuchus pallidicinctus]|uniref:centrosomal protein 20 isoform X2 n=1 Tax=Tympanuchus pallidicinctus TaxID=109042 RepID=UPI002286FFEB|nr:centrosomal protein 20 isoform X2 [Tympanuchus pallidicinctus]
MATIAELKAVLKDTLEKRGALGQIKARIRAEVFNALDDQSEPRPPLSHENLLINELIREYLEFNKYKYAASVLTAAGQPEVPLDRQFLVKELNIIEDANGKSVPLLYGIISHFLHHGEEESTQSTLPKVSLLSYPRQNFAKPSTERNQTDRIPEPGRMAGTSIEEPLVLQSTKR